MDCRHHKTKSILVGQKTQSGDTRLLWHEVCGLCGKVVYKRRSYVPIESYQKDKEIIKQYKSGCSVKEIADFYGVSRQAIQHRLERNNVQTVYYDYIKQQRDDYSEEFNNLHSVICALAKKRLEKYLWLHGIRKTNEQ